MEPMTLTNKALKRITMDAIRLVPPAIPRCAHAFECGGCAAQDRDYAGQVAAKRDVLRQLWDGILPTTLLEQVEIVASPDPYTYRTRMDYVASKGRFGLRRSGKFNYIVDLGECHLIPPAAFAVARAVYERAVALGLPDYNLRSHEGFLRYLVVRRSPQGSLLLAAVTASRAYPDKVAELAKLALADPQVTGFHWLLNDSLTDISFGEPIQYWGAATLPMQVGRRILQIGPNTFFQNNIHLLIPLLDDVAAAVSYPFAQDENVLAGRPPVVADLYGGVGTIALHLADQAAHVTCVESLEESARLAEYNLAANHITNGKVVAADVDAFLRDQQPGRFEVIVADPPRTGLGPEVCATLLQLRPRRLVYVSCNPRTQVADAEALESGYRLRLLRGYDMFPHTPHLEALAVFDQADTC